MQVQKDRTEIIDEKVFRIFTVDFFINLSAAEASPHPALPPTPSPPTPTQTLSASAAAEPVAETADVELSFCLPVCLRSEPGVDSWKIDSTHDGSALVLVHRDSSYIALPAAGAAAGGDGGVFWVHRHEDGAPTQLQVSLLQSGEAAFEDDASEFWGRGGGEVAALQLLDIPFTDEKLGRSAFRFVSRFGWRPVLVAIQ